MKLFNKVLWQLCCIANGAKLLIVSIFLKSVLRVACETETVRDYEIETAGTSLIVTFVNFFALRDVYQYKEENLDDTGPSSEVDTSFSGKRKLTEVFPDIPPKSPRNEYVDYWKDKAQELIAYKSFKQRQHHETAR